MGLGNKEWSFNIHDVAKGQYKEGQDVSGWLIVMTANTPDSPTVYTTQGGDTLTLTNSVAILPIANGGRQFYLDNSITSIDVSYMTANGECGFIRGATPSQHMLYVNSMAPYYKFIMPIQPNAASEVDTGIELPADLKVLDAGVRVTALDATETIDFGLLSSESGGDANGFLALATVAALGLVTTNPTVTVGSNETFMAACPIGALLGTFLAGTDLATNVGTFVRDHYITDGVAKTLTYTGSAGSDTAKGYVSLDYQKVLG